MVSEIIEIDGGYMESGGAILRVASGLSILTQKPFHIFDIRKSRPEGGLKAQHLTGVRAASEICGAKMVGASLGNTELTFSPGKLKPGAYAFDVGTAGSVSLVFYPLVIPSSVAEGKMSFEITGGTDVSWSPSMTYFDLVFSYWLEKMGCKIFAEVLRYGFYPKGGGKVKASVIPAKALKPLMALERGEFLRAEAKSIASDKLVAAKVAERQLEAAEKTFEEPFTNKTSFYVDTLSPGSSVHLHADYRNCRLGAGALGERGKPAEKVGEGAARMLKAQMDSGACLDRWMADQILPFLALAAVQTGKPSEVSVAEVTNHALTNAWVIEKFLPVKFEINGEKGRPGRIFVKPA